MLTRNTLIPGLLLLASCAAPSALAQDCGPVRTSISLDGRFGDWAAVLSSPANTFGDAFGTNVVPCGAEGDRDCPGNGSLDLRRFATTWDDQNLYVYLQRFSSAANDVKRWYYLFVDRQDEQFFGSVSDTERDLVLELLVIKDGPHDVEGEIFSLRPGTGRSLVDLADPTCGPAGDLPCADGYFPGDPVDSYDPVPPLLPPCLNGNCTDNKGLEIEYAFPWAQIGLAPGSAFSFHVSSGRVDSFPDSGDYLRVSTWDNMGGLAGGPGSTGYSCHVVTPDRELWASPGSTVVAAHVVRNEGNVLEGYALSVSSGLGWSLRLHADLDGDGALGPGDALLGTDANGDGDFTDPGDSVEPGRDLDGDGYPETGTLAPAVGGPGGEFALLVEIDVPAGAAGESDRVFVEASSARSGRAAWAIDLVQAGALVSFPDSQRRGVPGTTVPHALRLVNSGGTPDQADVALQPTLGWPAALLADIDCDGAGESPALTPVALPPGVETCWVLEVGIPPAAAVGDRESTRVTWTSVLDPLRSASVLDVTIASEAVELIPSHLVSEGRGKFTGPETSVFFPHVLRNNTGATEGFLLSHASSQGLAASMHVDGNCDGRPGDGASFLLPGSLAALPGFGGEACLVFELEVSLLPYGTVDSSDLFAVGSTSFQTGQARDETTVSGVATFSDALLSFASTSFGTCATVHAGGFGLMTSQDRAYLSWWQDPAGARRASRVMSSDTTGRLQDSLALGPADAAGDWTLTLRHCSVAYDAAGTCAGTETDVDAITFRVGIPSSIGALVTQLPTYALTGDDLTVTTRLRNDGVDATLSGSVLEHVVLTPARDAYLTPAGTFAPWTGAELTRSTTLSDLRPGEALDDVFTIAAVSFPLTSIDYEVRATWRSACGPELTSATWSFDVDDPCGPPLSETVGSSLRVAAPASLSWAPVAGAAEYLVHRGTFPVTGTLAARAQPHDHACLAVTAVPVHDDAAAPPGSGLYYLVAASNGCALAPAALGSDSLLRPRPVPPCP